MRISSQLRTRLYFCPNCGVLVSCVRKKRRNPGRKCKPKRCIDFLRCCLRHLYRNFSLVSIKISTPRGYRSFYKKYSVHFIPCDECRERGQEGIKVKEDQSFCPASRYYGG